MPDFAMCRDGKCPSRDNCRRWAATPDPYWQSYANHGRRDGERKCGAYMPVTYPTIESKPATRGRKGR